MGFKVGIVVVSVAFSASVFSERPDIGDVIALKSPNGKYVTANNNGSYWGTTNFNDLILVGNYNAPGDGYAQFLVENAGDGQVALKCLGNDKYLTVHASSERVFATADSVEGNWEKWTVEENGDKIGLRSAGTAGYLNARSGGYDFFTANREDMGDNGSFECELLGARPEPPYNLVGNIETNLFPEAIGYEVAANLLTRDYFWSGSDHSLHYSEYYTANGALRFARVTENTTLFNQLFNRYNTPTRMWHDGTTPVTGLMDDESLFMYPAPHTKLRENRTSVILLEWYKSTGNIDYYHKALERSSASRGGTTSYPNADSMFLKPTMEGIFYSLPSLSAAEKEDCVAHVSSFLSGYTKPVMQKDNGLYRHHPTDSKADDPLSFEVWGRGAGWCNMALAEGLTIMPKSDANWDRTYRSYLKFMDGLLGYQHSSGMWYQIMDRPGDTSPNGSTNWLESSGTAMACYSMVRGVKQGWLDANVYAPAIRKAWNALATRVDELGRLKNVCKGMSEARLGEGLNYYYGSDRDKLGDCHGQAPFLWLASELIESDFSTTPPGKPVVAIEKVRDGAEGNTNTAINPRLRLYFEGNYNGPDEIEVSCLITGGNATWGVDVGKSTLKRSLSAAATSKYMTLYVEDDAWPEKDETLVVSIDSSNQYDIDAERQSIELTIVDDDAPPSALSDSDGDGRNDFIEYVQGSNEAKDPAVVTTAEGITIEFIERNDLDQTAIQRTLMQATSLLGPWVEVSSASPLTKENSDGTNTHSVEVKNDHEKAFYKVIYTY